MSGTTTNEVHISIAKDTPSDEFAEAVNNQVLLPMLMEFSSRQADPPQAMWEALCGLLGGIAGSMVEIAGKDKTAQLLAFAASSTANLPAEPPPTDPPIHATPKPH